MTDIPPIQAKQPLANSSCLSIGLKSPDSKSVLSIIMNNEPDASIYLFGYSHRDGAWMRSGARLFAEEVLPQLRKRKIKDLVLEIFPAGKPDSKIERELAVFNRTGRIGSEMKHFLPYLDKANFIFLLQRIHLFGIKVHSGGVNFETAASTIGNSFFFTDERLFMQVINEINHNSSAAIAKLARGGKKVASFGGAMHNNLTPTDSQQKISFAGRLRPEFEGKMVEIDLVVPEISVEGENANALPLPAECDWKSFIPSRGRELVIPGPLFHTYLLYWPAKPVSTP